jgi:hypothetical protein
LTSTTPETTSSPAGIDVSEVYHDARLAVM